MNNEVLVKFRKLFLSHYNNERGGPLQIDDDALKAIYLYIFAEGKAPRNLKPQERIAMEYLKDQSKRFTGFTHMYNAEQALTLDLIRGLKEATKKVFYER